MSVQFIDNFQESGGSYMESRDFSTNCRSGRVKLYGIVVWYASAIPDRGKSCYPYVVIDAADLQMLEACWIK